MLTLLAIILASCDDGEEGVLPAVSPTAGTAAAEATTTPLLEETAVGNSEATPGLRPADGDTPAAGICAGPTSEPIVTIELLEGIPDPRCSRVTADQRIRFVNRLGERVTLTLGRYSATAAPNSSVLFDAPAGAYLAPGVHVVEASVPSGSAEIWLQGRE